MKTILLDTVQAVAILQSYCKAGARLHHFNGGQWYIELSEDCVAVMDTASRDNCRLDFMTEDNAIIYLSSGGNCPEENAFANSLKSFTDLIDRHAGRPVYS